MVGIREPEAPERVLLLSDASPLSLGVEALLRDRVALEVVYDLNLDRVQEHIRAFRPDTVVLGISARQGDPVQEQLQALSDLPGIQLITVTLQDNSARVYRRGQVQTVADAHGLLDGMPTAQP